MKESFKAIKISEHVYWVGAVDWAIRDFHGYNTSRGTTYNAYLIMGEKITLIDTVKRGFVDELLARIASVVDPKKVDYVISNHAELDHSGSLPEVINAVKPEKVIASKRGVIALNHHFHKDLGVEAVKDGSTLSLGNLEIKFVETRMVHWPDSMMNFVAEDGVLFSQDGFGMHLASNRIFADEISPDVLAYEGAKYYANILMLYSGLISRIPPKLEGLDIKVLAPAHGPVWRKDVSVMVKKYGEWSNRQPGKKAIIVYDTMWDATARMAGAIGEGLASERITAKLMPLKANHRSDIITELLDAGALLVGSPTLNNNVYPSIMDFLTYLKGLRFERLVAGAFGSYGWSGEAVKHIGEMLTDMKYDMVDGVKAQYVPNNEDLKKCYDMGVQVAQKL